MEESGSPADPSLWVLYFNRSQTDALRGLFAPIEKAVLGDKSRGAMQKNLEDLKHNLELRYSLCSGRLAQRLIHAIRCASADN